MQSCFPIQISRFDCSTSLNSSNDVDRLLSSGYDIGMYNYQGSTTLAFSSTTNEQYLTIWNGKYSCSLLNIDENIAECTAASSATKQ